MRTYVQAECWEIRHLDGRPWRECCYPSRDAAETAVKDLGRSLLFPGPLVVQPRSGDCVLVACDRCGADLEDTDGGRVHLPRASADDDLYAAGWTWQAGPETVTVDHCPGCPALRHGAPPQPGRDDQPLPLDLP